MLSESRHALFGGTAAQHTRLGHGEQLHLVLVLAGFRRRRKVAQAGHQAAPGGHRCGDVSGEPVELAGDGFAALDPARAELPEVDVLLRHLLLLPRAGFGAGPGGVRVLDLGNRAAFGEDTAPVSDDVEFVSVPIARTTCSPASWALSAFTQRLAKACERMMCIQSGR
ncbi:hypothetical protein MRBLMF1_006889 [Streptomyces ossamyceticus]